MKQTKEYRKQVEAQSARGYDNAGSKVCVPVFFSSDENYIPFLSVAIRSLIDNSSKKNIYNIYVLNTDISDKSKKSITDMATENVDINFIDVRAKMEGLGDESLQLRDYYTVSIYFRLFIASMFENIDKAIYMDCDIVVLDDVAKLYGIDIGDNLMGVITDKVVSGYRQFHSYSNDALGIPYEKYFNSGMLLMNLNEMRKADIENRFVELFTTYNFETIAPDQDYLNILCFGRVRYLESEWNVMWSRKKFDGTPKIVHYNMFKKPWIYSGVRFGDYFWEYAAKTEYYDKITKMQKRFSIGQRISDRRALRSMIKKSNKIVKSPNTFRKVLSK